MFLSSCKWCGLTLELTNEMQLKGCHCPRCRHVLIHRPQKLQNQKGLAAALAGIIALYPAISEPIFRVEMAGISNQASILDCVQILLNESVWLIFIVLIMMVVMPFFLLLSTAQIHLQVLRKRKLNIVGYAWFKVFNFCKEWAMIDVFLLALIVAYAKMGSFGSLEVLSGAYFFIFVFICCFISRIYTPETSLWLSSFR